MVSLSFHHVLCEQVDVGLNVGVVLAKREIVSRRSCSCHVQVKVALPPDTLGSASTRVCPVDRLRSRLRCSYSPDNLWTSTFSVTVRLRCSRV